MNKTSYIKIFLLTLIVFVGFFLRVYKIDELPYGFFSDEAANGFNAYKLLTTGKDEYGEPFPFYFRSFGDYRNPVAIYSMVPVISLFGLNEFSVRFTMAVYGTGAIIVLFFLVKTLFFNFPERIRTVSSLTSSLFLAISPWHIQFSRTGFEFTPMIFFLVLALFFLLLADRDKKPWLLCISMTSFVVTFYTYYPIQIVLIPFILGIIFIWRHTFFAKQFRIFSFFSIALFLLGLLPFILGVTSGKALTRFQSVSALGSNKSLKEVTPAFLKTYIEHFSLDFLFIKGDLDMPGHFITRHSVRGIGELYPFQLPFLIIGLIVLARNNLRIFWFLVLWFLLFPIGSTVVGQGPFAHRSLFGVIPFQIVSGYGLTILATSVENKKILKTTFWMVFIGIVTFSTFFYQERYFKEYPLYSSDYWGWQYGYRSIVENFKEQEIGYDQLLITHRFNSGEQLLKFYNVTTNCEKCTVMANPIAIDMNKKQLFALRQDDINEAENIYPHLQFITNKIIHLPNGNPEFFIGAFSQK